MTSRPNLNSSPASSYRKAAPPSISLSALAVRSTSSTRNNANGSTETEYAAWPNTTSLNQLGLSHLNTTNDGINSTSTRNSRRSESLDALTSKKARNEMKNLHNGTSSSNINSGRNKKGKNRAVAFVVGTNSSGSGDEGDASEPEEHSEDQEVYRRESGVDDYVKWQMHQPVQTINPLDLDSLLPSGIGDYTYVLSTFNSPSSSKSSSSPSSSSSASTSSSKPSRVSLGKGKFSEVLLVTKGDVEYALKHTPLYPHHPLIATRLLREPTILAQLRPHPNLVKVFETIRTPGHFYLVEENLRSSITLENLVASTKSGILDLDTTWDILEQLASVVHSLHEPLRVCHRDIKPENILIRVIPPEEGTTSRPKLILKLLDFGLATHYSSSEAKLTTCCGSPAYHSPELWRGLREPSGTVRYWGPEVDIWCLGLTLLRCLTPNKYPLGISHSSINALSDKVVDSLLSVENERLRRTLAGFMHMDGAKRMKYFDSFCVGLEARRSSVELERESILKGDDKVEEEAKVPVKKEFKTTSFVPTELRHSLDLPLVIPRTGVRSLESVANGLGSRSPSRSRLSGGILSRATSRATSRTPRNRGDSSLLSSALPSPVFDFRSLPHLTTSTAPSSALPSPALTPDLSTNWAVLHDSLPSTPATPNQYQSHLPYPPPIEIYLSNPTDEPIRRATSYIKYALRCAGILYHVRTDVSESGFSAFNAPIESFPSVNSISNISNGGNSSGHSSSVESPLPSTFTQLKETSDDPSDFITYLQCVIELPEVTDLPSRASSALIAALKPSIIRAHSTPPIGKFASNGTAVAGKKKKDVKALVFFISISKAPSRSRSRSILTYTRPNSAAPSSQNTSGDVEREAEEGEGEGAATPKPSTFNSKVESRRKSRRKKSGERIVISFSDERAVQSVRDALKGDTGNTLVEEGVVEVEGESRRGRKSRASSTLGPVITPTTTSSTSAVASNGNSSRLESGARVRRNESSHPKSENRTSSSPVGAGLGMSMGPPKSSHVAAPSPISTNIGGGGFFEFAFGRFPGLGGRTQSATNLALKKEEDTVPEITEDDKSKIAAMAMGGAMF